MDTLLKGQKLSSDVSPLVNFCGRVGRSARDGSGIASRRELRSRTQERTAFHILSELLGEAGVKRMDIKSAVEVGLITEADYWGAFGMVPAK